MAAAGNANADIMKFANDGFTNAAMAKVGTSAHRVAQARLPAATSDVIVPHKDELLFVASDAGQGDVRQRLAPADRSACSRWPAATAIATIKAQLANMRDGGFISAHDFHIGTLIADVVCGGDVDAGSLVSEEYLMALERKHFCAPARPPQDPGTHHGHAADRQAVELRRLIMSKQVQDAYIVAATRTPIGRSGRGYFRNTRPDDLLVAAVQERAGAGAHRSTRRRSRTPSSAAASPRASRA